MTHMFDHYPQPEGYVPHNRQIHVCCCRNIDIMAGETTSHSFEVPFNVEQDATDYKIMYKLGLNIVVEKGKDDIDMVPYDAEKHFCILSCELSPEETSLFAGTFLDCSVQIKFILNDDTTIYTEVYPVKLMNSLDV